MNNSFLASIEGTFKSFFASLATSISYDIIFYAALGVQLFIIIIFAIKSRYSYEIRMTKSLDKLNRWLFHYKTITKENIKEFTNLMKKAPKRLSYNWQQYILYRDKAPSNYLSVENIVDKPLKNSTYSINVRNMNIISLAWMFIVLLATVAKNNVKETAEFTMSAFQSILVIPLFLIVLIVFTNIIFSAKKTSNADELYQNLHLFDRFIDNACTGLPKYIDYSLLFTNQEIARGIPELREYYENRARKEKEEFEKAQEQEEEHEKFDFSAVGIDGSNILDRALKECELFLNKKAKILANISERESSLESLKKNFDNIQKEFQKKMQVSKENIDRLRQQQEETTSRIEGNFLRRQMESTIAKQEGEEAEYENQKRSYLSQKAEYEEQIKNYNAELESMKENITVVMESEYETFYEKLFKTSVTDAEDKVVEKFNTMREERDTYEEQLTDSQTKLKRLIDENETLRNKLGITETSEILTPSEPEPSKKKKAPKPEEELFFDHSNDEPIKKVVPVKEEGFVLDAEPETKEEKKDEGFALEDSALEEKEPEEKEDSFVLEEDKPQQESNNAEPFALEDEAQEAESTDANEYDFEEVSEMPKSTDSNDEDGETSEEFTPLSDISQKVEYDFEESEEQEQNDESTNETEEENAAEPSKKKSRGRPKGSIKVVKVQGPKKPKGRPKGSVKVVKVDKPKKPRGRPKKAEGLDKINQRIDEEEQRLFEAQKNLNDNIKEVVADLETKSIESIEREKISKEIDELKQRAKELKKADASAIEDIEAVNKQIEELLERMKKLK